MDATDGNIQTRSERKSLMSRIKSRRKLSRKDDVVVQIDSERSSLLSVDDKPNSNEVAENVKNGRFINLTNRIIVHNKIKEDKDEERPILLQVVDDAMKNEFGGWGDGRQRKRRIDLINTDLLESIEVDDYKWSIKSLEKGASVEATCVQTGLTACHIAAYYGREKILKELIKRNANISRGDDDGRLPLDIAAWQGHIKCVEILLKAKDSQQDLASSPELWSDSINHDCLGIRNKISEIYIGCSALHIASARLQVECVKSLLESDYSPIVHNVEGLTPLDVCGKAYEDDLASITEKKFFETLREFIAFAKLKRSEKDIQNTMKYHEQSEASTTPLHLAVLLNSKYSIQLLLDVSAYPGCRDNQGETPLHLAVTHKRIKPLIALTNICLYGQDNVVDILNNEKYTALHMAVKSVWMKGVSILLEAGADIMAVTGEGNTVLHLAVQTGNQALLKELIRNIPDKNELINWKNYDGETPLYTAVIHSQISCLRELLLEKASCDITLKDGVNILQKSADTGNSKVLSILLAEKSNKELINKQEDIYKMSPLHWAASKNHLQCVITLCEAGADMKLRAYEEITPLHLAARQGHVEIIRWMLDKDPSLMEERDFMKWLPFHSAAYFGHRKCIELFLERGADFSEMISDSDCKTKTVLATMTSNMHRAVDYLEDIFNYYIKINTYHLDEPDCQITIDYSILMPHRSDTHKTNRQLETMNVVKALTSTSNKYDINKLVIHPLIESFMYLQWKALKRFFYCILYVYAFFVIALTVSAISLYKYENFGIEPPVVYHKMAWKIFLWAMVISILLQEILFVISKKMMYLNSYEVWVKLASLILGTAFTFIDHKVESHWPRYITAAAILLAWMEIIILLSRFPEFGFFYQMFSTVAVRALKVMALFGCFMIIGFSLAFWILFESKSPFEGPWKSIMKTIVMMTSEFDYADMAGDKGWDEYPTFPQILFVIFLISVPIVVMNLLLALAVSDTKDLEIEGKIQRLSQQIDFLSTLDNLVYAVAWKYVPDFIKGYMESWRVPKQVIIMPGQPKWCNELLSECIITSVCQRASEKRKLEDSVQKTKTFVSQMEDVQKMLKIVLENTENDKKNKNK